MFTHTATVWVVDTMLRRKKIIVVYLTATSMYLVKIKLCGA